MAVEPHASPSSTTYVEVFAEVSESQISHVRAGVQAQYLELADDDTIKRFVRATGGNLPLSIKRLNHTLAWRHANKPEEVVCSACARDPRSHYMHVVGFCNRGRPLMYSCIALAANKVHEDNKEHLIQTFETAVKCMRGSDPFLQQWVWINDFEGFGLSDALNVRIAKTFLDLSASHYPERLGMVFLVGAPKVFDMMWSAVSGLIDPKTAKKVRFLPYDVGTAGSGASAPKSRLVEELKKVVDEETLGWLLTEMAQNRVKATVRTKAYDMHAIHKAASQGQLCPTPSDVSEAAAAGRIPRVATDHDLRGTGKLLCLYEERPDILAVQAAAAAAQRQLGS